MRAIFTSNGSEGHPGYAERSGQTVEATPLDPTTYDRADVGDMYRIRFSDGVETDAFEDELTEIGA